MNSFEEKIALSAVAALGAYWLYKKFTPPIPQVVKDGAEATVVLAKNAGNIITNPGDAFGISPAVNPQTGAPYWERTTPQANPDDVVSNGSGGMNYNDF